MRHIISIMNYAIYVGIKLNDMKTLLPIISAYPQLVIITDHTVKKMVGKDFNISLQKKNINVNLFSFPPGEKNKNNQTKQKIEDKMLKLGYGKDTLILALGGGVVGDIAGFIASTYLRGIDYLQIPTTLLAMVDSSIGGKTAINTAYGKNLIGSIYQPIGVIADTELLASLSKKHIINGLIEAIKMFLTHDKSSFNNARTNLDEIIKSNPVFLNEIITSAITVKARVVKNDPSEMGERFLLNFGHTIGHALEALSDYQLLHGYAVAYGILVESTVSFLLGLLSNQELLIIKALFKKMNIQGCYLKKFDISDIIKITKRDKKSRAGKVNYVLLKSIGKAYITNQQYVHSVNDKVIKQAYQYLTQG